MFQSIEKAMPAKSALPMEHEQVWNVTTVQDLFVCYSDGPLAAKNVPQTLHVKNVSTFLVLNKGSKIHSHTSRYLEYRL